MKVNKLMAVLLALLMMISCGVVFSASANSDTAEIVLGDKTYTADTGDKFMYTLYLSADEKFEDFQAYFTYDNTVIKALPYSDSEEDYFDLKYAPNLLWPVTNINLEGKIKHNSSSTDGFDFTEEKVLFTCWFEVVGTGTASISYDIVDMTILGGSKAYFADSQQIITEGISLRNEITFEEVETTAAITEPEESNTATEPEETTAPVTDATEDEIQTTTATEDESSTATEATTAPILEGLLGDANLDGKVNIKDVTLIQKYAANITPLTDEQYTLADTNRDTKVNIKDATAIQKFIAGIIKEF